MSEVKDSKLRVIDSVGLCLCAALSVAVYFIAVQPVLDKRAVQRAEAVELSAQQDKSDELSVSLASMRQTLTETEDAMASSPLRLQSLTKLNQRLAHATALAGECELILDRLEPGKPEEKSHYMMVPVHIAGTGGYASVVQFLDRLHADWPDLAVASLDLQGNPRNRGDLPRFTLELLWFAAPSRP